MSDVFLLIAIALINALSIALAYNLGTRRTTPFNIRSAFRTLIEKRTSITSPHALNTVKRSIHSLIQ